MNNTHQQTNNNQTATFPRTPTAHKKASGETKAKPVVWCDWYAESTTEERIKLIGDTLKARGWLCGSDGFSFLSVHGYVARLETERSRYLEVFVNGKVFCDVDMRGFNAGTVNDYIERLLVAVIEKARVVLV